MILEKVTHSLLGRSQNRSIASHSFPLHSLHLILLPRLIIGLTLTRLVARKEMRKQCLSRHKKREESVNPRGWRVSTDGKVIRWWHEKCSKGKQRIWNYDEKEGRHRVRRLVDARMSRPRREHCAMGSGRSATNANWTEWTGGNRRCGGESKRHP